MKKSIAILLATVLCFNTVSSVFAKSLSDSEVDDLILKQTDNGVYVPVSNNITTESYSSNDEDIVVAKPTDDLDIYYLKDDEYVTKVDDDTYLLVNKVDLDVEDFDANKTIFDNYNISKKLREDIDKEITRQNELGNDEFEVSIYAPASISTKNASTSTSYYHSGGHDFRDTIVKYENSSTKMTEKNGSKAKNVAGSFYNFVLSSVGMASKTVSAFSAGMSALDVFEAIYGPVEYGSNTDRLYTLVLYDKYEKQTDMMFGDNYWETGCISYKVKLKRNDTYQLYAASGNSYLKKYALDTVYYSESYRSAAETVLENFPTPYFDNAIRIKVYTTTYVL